MPETKPKPRVDEPESTLTEQLALLLDELDELAAGALDDDELATKLLEDEELDEDVCAELLELGLDEDEDDFAALLEEKLEEELELQVTPLTKLMVLLASLLVA